MGLTTPILRTGLDIGLVAAAISATFSGWLTTALVGAVATEEDDLSCANVNFPDCANEIFPARKQINTRAEYLKNRLAFLPIYIAFSLSSKVVINLDFDNPLQQRLSQRIKAFSKVLQFVRLWLLVNR